MAAPMRRLVALLCAALAFTAAPSAAAQSPSATPEPASVRLRLLRQTPWNSLKATTLDVRFRATNLSDAPLEELTIGVTMFGRVTSRTAYEQSLLTDPSPAVVVAGQTLARTGEIAAGESRDFAFSLELVFPGIDRTQSGIYPLKVDLRSDGVPVAALRTPVIFLVRIPEEPLALSWTFVLDEPIAFRPDGVFATTSMEQAIGPGGRVGSEIRALARLAESDPTPVDVAVSPMLLSQLSRMRDGYTVAEAGDTREVPASEGGAAAAAGALDALTTAVVPADVELSTLPFSEPQIPSLVSGGLGRDLDVQLERGRKVAVALIGALPDPGVLRPPAGALDDASLEALAARGVGILLVDPDTVESPLQPLGFAPPPVAEVGSGGRVLGVVPDPSVATLLASPTVSEDPVLGAQAVLGELAAIWQQQPGEARGIAIAFPDGLDLPGGFFGPFIRGVAGAPWLRPVSARDLTAGFPPSDGELSLTTPPPATFSQGYVDDLKQERRLVDVYRSMIVGESPEPDRLDTQLLLAESGSFLSNPASGYAFIAAVRDEVDAALGAVRAEAGPVGEAGPVVTLTSRSGGRIPVRVTNDGEQTFRVSIALVSSNLRESPGQEVVLDPGATRTLTFGVDAKTTGRFVVSIQVIAPAGRVIGQSSVIVRSTAYSRIALIITIAAGLVLVLLWARRFLPRPKT
jgi:hypothetical protein